MNMIDVNKTFRGVLVWREDVLKCERCLKMPLSQVVRDALHRELSRFSLAEDGMEELDRQIADARAERKRKHSGRRGRAKKMAVDVVAIPKSVRENPVFVQGE